VPPAIRRPTNGTEQGGCLRRSTNERARVPVAFMGRQNLLFNVTLRDVAGLQLIVKKR